MYLDATIRVSEDGSKFLGFYTKDKETNTTKEIKFYEDSFKNYWKDGTITTANLKGPIDNVHPLLGEAHQLKSGDYQGIVNLLERAIQDEAFMQTVHIRHRDPLYIFWGGLYDSELGDLFEHVNELHPKIFAHDCSAENFLSFVKAKLERENAPLSDRLTREFTLAKRKSNFLADNLLKSLTGKYIASALSTSFVAPILITRLGYQVGSSMSWKIKSFF